MTPRRYRAWKAGTRVRLVVPLMLSGKMPAGTIAQDAGPDDLVFLLRDDKVPMRRPAPVCSNELERLRDQTPNPNHVIPAGAPNCWWIDLDL